MNTLCPCLQLICYLISATAFGYIFLIAWKVRASHSLTLSLSHSPTLPPPTFHSPTLSLSRSLSLPTAGHFHSYILLFPLTHARTCLLFPLTRAGRTCRLQCFRVMIKEAPTPHIKTMVKVTMVVFFIGWNLHTIFASIGPEILNWLNSLQMEIGSCFSDLVAKCLFCICVTYLRVKVGTGGLGGLGGYG